MVAGVFLVFLLLALVLLDVLAWLRAADSRDGMESEEWELRPGEQVALKLSATPGSRYIGVLAAYRDLPQVRWRHVVPLAVESRTRVDLVLDETGVHATDVPPAKAGG